MVLGLVLRLVLGLVLGLALGLLAANSQGIEVFLRTDPAQTPPNPI